MIRENTQNTATEKSVSPWKICSVEFDIFTQISLVPWWEPLSISTITLNIISPLGASSIQFETPTSMDALGQVCLKLVL